MHVLDTVTLSRVVDGSTVLLIHALTTFLLIQWT